MSLATGYGNEWRDVGPAELELAFSKDCGGGTHFEFGAWFSVEPPHTEDISIIRQLLYIVVKVYDVKKFG